MNTAAGLSGIPYHNLFLTGSVGSRLIQTGQIMARQLGVPYFHLDTELQTREGYPADELRKLYGEAYVRRLELELCREFGLRRSTIISVNPTTLLDEKCRERLLAAGSCLYLTCTLNEALRRIYIAQGAAFHDPRYRASMLHAVQRDSALLKLGELTSLDTTLLTIEQTAEKAVKFWQERETIL